MGVRCRTELAGVYNVKSKSVKKCLPTDMERSGFIEIKKSYQTDNINGRENFRCFRELYIFRFERFSLIFRKENIEIVRDTVCNVKIVYIYVLLSR